MSAVGFAYADGNGHISVKTVSMTEQGAKVNAIVIYSQYTVLPKDHWSAEVLEKAFSMVTGGRGSIIPIEVIRR